MSASKPFPPTPIDIKTATDGALERRLERLGLAFSGRFSSDRTIREYAEEIWDMKPSPVS